MTPAMTDSKFLKAMARQTDLSAGRCLVEDASGLTIGHRMAHVMRILMPACQSQSQTHSSC